MSVTFSQSQDRAFIQSQCRARQSGLAGVLQTVEHLEEFDTSHLANPPVPSQTPLINAVNALPWTTLDPFPPEIEPPGFIDANGFQLLGASRSYKAATANISDGHFSSGALDFPSAFITSPYVPMLPVVKGVGFTGQTMFGSCSGWTYGLQGTGGSIPRAGRGRTKWSRDSTVFVLSAEVTVTWPFTGPFGDPWNLGAPPAFLKNFQLIKPITDLPAKTWYEAPIIDEVRGPFWDGSPGPSDGFQGMFTIPIFFETPLAWQSRTGINLALSGSQA